MLTRRAPRFARAALLLVLASSLLACGWGDDASFDPALLPDVTYARHIRPRIAYYCSGCHQPSAVLGTAGGWDFSSYVLVRGSFTSIMRAAFELRKMPPGGARKMTPEDHEIFKQWERQGFVER